MYRAHHNVSRWILCLLAALAPIASADALPGACDAARTILPSDAERHAEGAIGETHCYRLELAASGLVHLNLSIAGWEAARARLRLFGANGAARPPEALQRSAGELLALAGPGTWWLEVAAEDPRLPLPAYRLASRFVELEARPGAPATKDGENEGELEPDPETFTAGGAGGPLRQALCRTGDVDDHGDSFACATAFYGDATGELGNGWGDDADLFRFRLLDYRTLVIASEGDADTYGELYDRNGQRLAGSGDGGEGENFRLVRTLGPGVYFVRVEGRDSTGAYRLVAHDVER